MLTGGLCKFAACQFEFPPWLPVGPSQRPDGFREVGPVAGDAHRVGEVGQRPVGGVLGRQVGKPVRRVVLVGVGNPVRAEDGLEVA